ncbi:MAG TPA: hypothetical protein VJT09_20010 [Pyrinomonadaceae bacterium]|nr:hypothetical protein [Pyrinomonadaceae bacterium]
MSLKQIPISTRVLSRLVIVLAIACALAAPAFAQTDGGTDINNTASASYSDGTNDYNVNSNTVTVKVSNVAGLTISPDGGSLGSQIVAGETGIVYSFTVTNTGNFSDRVQFLTGGASIRLSGTASASITRAVIDNPSAGTPNQIDGSDTDIYGNAGVVTSPVMARNTSLKVLVEVSVGAGATAGQTVVVTLGDASADSQNADNSANEVRTSHPVGTVVVNGDATNHNVEAVGDITATVQTDAQLQLSLTAPTGPVPLGSNITYQWQLCNIGSRAAKAVTLTTVNGGGSNQGVFIFAPVPANTVLAATQNFPAGVGVLYSNSNPALNPITQMTWETVRPANVTMVAFNVSTPLNGGTLAASTCSSNIDMVVTITTSDATNAITEQGNAYGRNSLDVQLPAAVSPLRTTTLLQTGGVLNGPQGAPGAIGTTTDNDYTDKSVPAAAILNVPAYPDPANVTVALGSATFTNTVQNLGNANDTYALSVLSYPAGADVTIIVGATSTLMVDDGTPVVGASASIAVAYNSTANYQVVVSMPAGKAVLTGFDTVIRATSGIDNTQTNNTIDRLFTGFIQLEKAVSINNADLTKGGANDPVPGAVLTYTITYTNVATSVGGAGCVKLTANNLVITENGTAGGNNWATHTTQLGSPTDSGTGVISVNGTATIITDTVAAVAPGTPARVFTFQRTIN